MSLFNAIDVSASGLAAQRARVEFLTQNIANAETTRTPEGGPYRRRSVIFESRSFATSRFQNTLNHVNVLNHQWFGSPFPGTSEIQGVRVGGVVVDPSEPELRYMPEHPDANELGYVEFPPFSPVRDMVDLTASVRSYQANLSAIESARDMINSTIELARG